MAFVQRSLDECTILATLQTFHRIRINRANRIRVKGRKRRADECDDTPERGAGSSGVGSGTPCPVCGERMHGTPDELNQHVVRCLRRVIELENVFLKKRNNELDSKQQNGEDPDDDEPLDVEGDSYEEYEWAGQRRIRATSMLEGGFAGKHVECPFGALTNMRFLH